MNTLLSLLISFARLLLKREVMKKQLEKVKNQKEKLESLCRSLQAERKHNLVNATSDPVAVAVAAALQVTPSNEDSS